MYVKAFTRICAKPQLQELVAATRSKDKIRTKKFVENLLNTKQEELFKVFLGCLYEKRDSNEYRDTSRRLFRVFSEAFDGLGDEERRQFTDSFHKEVQKVSAVYARRTSSLDGKFETATFRLKDLEKRLKKLQESNYKRAARQEADVNRYSLKHEGIQRGVEEFQRLNDTDYPHSVIQLDNSPKMVIIGCPRKDRPDSLTRFFSIMLEENVDVIVALNTSVDWEEAISYYEPHHLNSVQIDGHTISCKKSVLLYEGRIAVNMPPKVQKELSELSPSDRYALLISERYEKYRPRVVERTFEIRENSTGLTREITQLHYKNWPDRQASPDIDGWWILLQRQLELLEGKNGALAIHCQGGIGRTNVHAILTCLVSEVNALAKANANLEKATFNVPLTMLRLKEQAPRLGGMVSGKRFAQIYEMLLRYYREVEQKA
jgi:protein tyrosine phosphatase